MLYAGCTVFPISTRNGPAAIAHLLSQTQASYLFVSNEPAIQNIAREAVHGTDSFKQSVAGKPEIHLMPVFEDLFSADSSEHHVMSDMPQGYDLDAPAVILHSSGMFVSCPIAPILKCNWDRLYGYAKADRLDTP